MKRIINSLIWFVLIPGVIIGIPGIFGKNQYQLTSLVVVVLVLIPFLINFEARKHRAAELVLMAVLTAITVISRIIFSPLPFFKPVTAILVLIALVLGRETGFIIGALAALLSNFYFGQGPWTPYQMFAWGIVAYLAGVFSRYRQRLVIVLLLGLLSGVLFSVIMDVQYYFFLEDRFDFGGFWLVMLKSLPMTLTYMASNVIFLFLFRKIFITRLERVKKKYGLFETNRTKI
ncbi:MAG: ECF transporter S component [Acholeplasmataceae bacterium]|jgi:energy-coupling factor transport system substrate-specific component|nr:ECF transporter S component [Acholeplasmataceae bacterium]